MLYKLTTDCRRFSLAILPVLLVAITALTPLAFASPPDPSWVQGIYDDADFDDVVVFIASGAAVVELFLQMLGQGYLQTSGTQSSHRRIGLNIVSFHFKPQYFLIKGDRHFKIINLQKEEIQSGYSHNYQ